MLIIDHYWQTEQMLEGLIWNKFVCSIFFSNKWSTNRIRVSLSKLLLPRECNIQNFILISHYKFSICTLRSQMEGSLLISIIFIHFSLPAVIWAYPFINFQENFQPPCFFNKDILPSHQSVAIISNCKNMRW